jgi:IS1 family transposase
VGTMSALPQPMGHDVSTEETTGYWWYGTEIYDLKLHLVGAIVRIEIERSNLKLRSRTSKMDRAMDE